MFKKRILQILIILFLVVFAANTLKQVFRLNQAKAKFGKAVAKLESLKAENERLKAEQQFRETPEFVEKAARDRLGLAKEGETVVILPKLEAQTSEKNPDSSNLKSWLKRLFGKS